MHLEMVSHLWCQVQYEFHLGCPSMPLNTASGSDLSSSKRPASWRPLRSSRSFCLGFSFFPPRRRRTMVNSSWMVDIWMVGSVFCNGVYPLYMHFITSLITS